MKYFKDTFQTLWTQWSNTCYFEEQISVTATEWLTPLLGIASVKSETLSSFLKNEKLADIGLQNEFLEVFNHQVFQIFPTEKLM